jgi:parallel beta-helix repeat protein
VKSARQSLERRSLRREFGWLTWAFLGAVWVALSATALNGQSISYVDSAAQNGGNGSAWESAFRTIEEALADAREGQTIYVKSGEYRITKPITIPSGIKLIGGFAGHEKSPADRRCINQKTMSMLRQTSASGSVMVLSKVQNVVVDGFTITGANGSPGLLIEECDASVHILHCTVSGNVSQMGGAGIRVVNGSNPQVFNCKISENTVTGSEGGGGIYVDETSAGSWSYCIFSHNKSDGESAGGALIRSSAERAAVFYKSDFFYNQSGKTGSALSVSGAAELVDCVVASNLAREASSGHSLHISDQGSVVFRGNSYLVANLGGENSPAFVPGAGGSGRFEVREGAIVSTDEERSVGKPSDSLQKHNDVHLVPRDIFPPALSEGGPAPGKRVKIQLPSFKNTKAYHCLYLPVDWKPGAKYPVIVEFPGNGPFRSRFGDLSGGLPEDCHLGFGVSGGNAIVLSLGYLDARKEMQPTGSWWGDVLATLDYTKKAVRDVTENYGGDPRSILLAGFSRSAIGASFVGLHDDEIATLWAGILCYDGWEQADYIKSDTYRFDKSSYGYDPTDENGTGVETRFERIAGRPVCIIGGVGDSKKLNAKHGFPLVYFSKTHRNHNTSWSLRCTPEREFVRRWLRESFAGNLLGKISEAAER